MFVGFNVVFLIAMGVYLLRSSPWRGRDRALLRLRLAPFPSSRPSLRQPFEDGAVLEMDLESHGTRKQPRAIIALR